jgi:hypothetical protein
MPKFDWDAHISILEEKLKHAREIVDETERALKRAHGQKHGLTEGCTVRHTKEGGVYKFAELFYYSTYLNGKPWIKGHIKKKDGEWSKNTKTLYSDWELIERAPDAPPDANRASTPKGATR